MDQWKRQNISTAATENGLPGIHLMCKQDSFQPIFQCCAMSFVQFPQLCTRTFCLLGKGFWELRPLKLRQSWANWHSDNTVTCAELLKTENGVEHWDNL